MNEILAQKIMGNSVERILLSLAVFFLFIVFFWILKSFLIKKLAKLSTKTKTQIDDLLIDFFRGIRWHFLVAFSLFFSTLVLSLPEQTERIIKYFFIIIIAIEVVKLVQVFIDFGARKYSSRESAEYKDAVRTIASVAKGGTWVLAVLVVVQNMGVNISSLVAGLGIGGIAIAIAVQGVLGDIFSSFSILFDKPFKTGDEIMIGHERGIVKKIGIKTTRITTFRGEEVIISNKQLTDSSISNFAKLKRWRNVTNIGVTYETPHKKLEKIPDLIRDIFEDKELEKADLVRVHFESFGDFALNFQITFYINTSDYNEYMDVKEKINYKIFLAFAKEKIEFAYPSQKIFLEKVESNLG